MILIFLACGSPPTDSVPAVVEGCVPTEEIANDGVDQDCDFSDFVDHDLDGDERVNDCDDDDPLVHFGADELCDGLDNDCNGLVDELIEVPRWFPDVDGDGHAGAEAWVEACVQPAGFLDVADDCDDERATVHPGAPELCDGLDNDCDGTVSEYSLQQDWFGDADGDGHGDPARSIHTCAPPEGYTTGAADDCDDGDAATFPGAAELCDDVDNDCDGEVDDGLDLFTWYGDADGDGYGEESVTLVSCGAADGYAVAGDCDDGNSAVYPGAAELCDGLDNDCDGLTPSAEVDGDGDGSRVCDADCDDADATRRPGFVEECDGIDNDCDEVIDSDCVDCDATVPGDFATVQEAVDAAVDGDVVCVGAGTWFESVDFGGTDLTLLGAGGSGVTFLDGGGVRFTSGEGSAAVLEGFTIQGRLGNGVYVTDSSPTLRDLDLAGMFSSYGGAIYVEGGSPSLEGVRVHDNDVGETSGCYSHPGYGGGLYASDSDVLVSNAWFWNNDAASGGGGIAGFDSDITLVNTVFESNSAYRGGGVYLSGGSLQAENVVFVANEATVGAGLDLETASAALANVLLLENLAEVWGGGLYVGGGTVTLSNSIVYGNAAASGAGIDLVSGVIDIDYCDIVDGVDGMPDPVGVDGNVAVDPELLDWRLDSASPVIGAGDPTVLDPDGSTADMGAFGGPDANAWDLDGDGFVAYWSPGAYTGSELDCDDTDAGVYPGSGC